MPGIPRTSARDSDTRETGGSVLRARTTVTSSSETSGASATSSVCSSACAARPSRYSSSTKGA
ncbi:MAG: hypothetical protein A2138_09370 [Deltaproteobacteria bacterium RBG_16_71_12]|nr:MAG: hypothetical protein A2138_09370 [Deltaproteobacteria bacterium RBG_16_71_12]